MSIHKQEVLKYQNTYSILVANTVNANVFVIDDVDHSTMLLAKKY